MKKGASHLGTLKDNLTSRIVDSLLIKHGFKSTTPVGDLPEHVMAEILYGTETMVELQDNYGGSGRQSALRRVGGRD